GPADRHVSRHIQEMSGARFARQRAAVCAGLTACALLCLSACGGSGDASAPPQGAAPPSGATTPSPTPAPSPTSSSSPTPTPSASPQPTPTSTPSATPTPGSTTPPSASALWSPVAGFAPPAAGEHPRLFFRRTQIEAVREKSRTLEGAAIVARLRFLLNGGDGQSLPVVFNSAKGAYQGFKPVTVAKPGDHPGTGVPGGADKPGVFTLWHASGYAMLYQLTGEARYADMARTCTQWMIEGWRDRDDRYGLVNPGGLLRAGPSVAALAMAYDLAYDGWDSAFRESVAKFLLNYNGGATEPGGTGTQTMAQLSKTPRHSPKSNHWGGQVGGAGLAMLAIRGDAGADPALVQDYLSAIEKNTARALLEGFGSGGYFWEHLGPGGIATETAFVPYLQALRVAHGQDWTAGSASHGRALAGKWIHLMTVRGGKPFYTNPNPSGSYGTEVFDRHGISRAGQFAQGFGVMPEAWKPAMLWTYKTLVEPGEQQSYGKLLGGKPSYDAIDYPHRAVLALINWPIGTTPENPGTRFAKVLDDPEMRFTVMRDQWKDDTDSLVALLAGANDLGHDAVLPIQVWAAQGRALFGHIEKTAVTAKQFAQDGSGLLALKDGSAIAVDFGKSSGAHVLIAVAGKAAELRGTATSVLRMQGGDAARFRATRFTLGGVAAEILTVAPNGMHPAVTVVDAAAGKVAVGAQTLTLNAGRWTLAAMAPPISAQTIESN
ncbi:MAG: hypothetical protein ACRCV9_17055, partial [Burkholderiaceae bacterium]